MRLRTRLVVLAALTHAASAAAQPAHLVADLSADPSSYSGSYVVVRGGMAGKAFFTIETGDGREMWASDGTAAGTTLLADTCPGPCAPTLDVLGTVNGLTLWSAADAGGLIRSDGTRAGTYRLAGPEGDLFPFTALDQRVVAQGRLFFSGRTAANGSELWQTDGTRTGTVRVTDLAPGAEGSHPSHLVAAGAALFFSAQDGEYGAPALYVIVGPGAAPRRLVDLTSSIRATAAAGARIFYLTGDYASTELWTSDGTAAGTRMLRSFPRGTYSESGWLEAAGNRVLFAADDGTHGPQVWRSDGTTAGTVRLTTLAPVSGELYITPTGVEALGEGVLVIYRESSASTKLYATAGPGQPMVVVQSTCPQCGFVGGLQRFGDRVVFGATTAASGCGRPTAPSAAPRCWRRAARVAASSRPHRRPSARDCSSASTAPAA
ncbi:MAG TPA: hypothetical protein VFS60_04865 [Thermoanaerobaculia bacterium]|nr:hypothetical protein [Thermoanaerobaculia bacterium]